MKRSFCEKERLDLNGLICVRLTTVFVCVFYSLNVYEPLKYQIENWIEMFGIMGLYFLTNNPLNELFSCDRSFVFNGSNQNTFF